MPNALARPLEATIYTSPKFLQEPVQQPVRRGRLPRAIPRIPTILHERRYAEFQASRQAEELRGDDLEEALSQDYIRIVRNPDGTRTVSLAGRYMSDKEYAAESLWDVLKEFEQRFDVRPPQARPSQRVLRLCDEELKHG
ncbi:hypothetical protein [Cupriavidus gilardii]|uniref:hypothetical protein n=1 Tax=Cupriavidus gilardii TaxID=82541 RepID=UPI0021B42C06|nr:hypothetical protein [Cupriavidus gilardii]UXC37102.1 hypothetical protein N4G38_06535 [Cupriavidus gilardii]